MKSIFTGVLSAIGFFAILSLATLALTQAPSFAQVPAQVTPALGGLTKFANGGSSTPSVSFLGSSFDGFYWNSAGHVVYTSQGNQSMDFGTGLTLNNTYSLGWANNASPAGGSGLDTAFTRVAAGEFGWTAVLFANLGAPAAGTFAYCSDCTLANPCAGAGTGALAKRLNGVWVCN